MWHEGASGDRQPLCHLPLPVQPCYLHHFVHATSACYVRLTEYEARASAALQQAVTEEEHLEKVTKEASMRQEMLDTAFKSVKVC